MPFDAKAFMQARLTARTRAVGVPTLRRWFGQDDRPIWKVRGLTANELAKVNDAERRNKREAALLDALSDGTRAEIVKEIQHALGRSDDTMPDLARRLEMLIAGSVEPVCSEDMAVKIAEKFPVQFYELTNIILDLTGQGSDVSKKPEPSTDEQTSVPA